MGKVINPKYTIFEYPDGMPSLAKDSGKEAFAVVHKDTIICYTFSEAVAIGICWALENAPDDGLTAMDIFLISEMYKDRIR